jgi:hypothetical protein
MLTDRQKDTLTFHGAWPGGNMEAAVRDRFGVPFVRYVQELYAALDAPAALEFEPMLVKRLQRIRLRRSARRSLPFDRWSA